MPAAGETIASQTPRPSEPLYLDDLHVGLRFVSGAQRIDPARMVEFAAEFDPQPFHLDRERAAATSFGGLVASGWHTAAITMRLLVDGGLPIAGGIVGAGGEISWVNPVRPGDTLIVHSEVVDIVPSRSRPDRGIVTVRSETRTAHGTVVQIFIGKIVVPRRAAPEQSGGTS